MQKPKFKIDEYELYNGAWFETSNGWFIRVLDRKSREMLAIAYEPTYDAFIMHKVTIKYDEIYDVFVVILHGRVIDVVSYQLQPGDHPEFEKALIGQREWFIDHPLYDYFNHSYVPALDMKKRQVFVHGVYAEVLGRTEPKLLVEITEEAEDANYGDLGLGLELYDLEGYRLKPEKPTDRDINEYELKYVTEFACGVKYGDLKL